MTPSPAAKALARGVLIALAVLPGGGVAATEDLYPYRTALHDTLIGLSRRLLRDPRQWHAIQTRNHVAEPTRMPVGTLLWIPRDWLRQSPESATVTTVFGEATRDGLTARPGDVLAPGAKLATGLAGYLTITLADGSTVTLGSQSTAELDRLIRYDATGVHDTELRLSTGTLTTRVTPQPEAGRFQIRTPVAISAVRGTEFRRAVEPDGARDRTEVLGGAVEVAARDTAVRVPTGFGTVADTTGGAHAPNPLLEAPSLAGLPPVIVSERFAIRFPPVAGATRYRAQLAQDREFREIVEQQTGEAPELEFAGAPDGAYWLDVRAIDAEDVEGLDAIRAIERRPLPLAPAPAEPAEGTRRLGGDTVLRWSVPARAVGYRVELTRGSEPAADPVLTRETTAPELAVGGLAPASYAWRVAAVDATGAQGPWSAPAHFEQRPPPPEVAGLTVTRRAVELSWTLDPAGPVEIEVARDAGFHEVLERRTVTETRASLARHEPGLYHVRLRRVDVGGGTDPAGPAWRYFVPWPFWPWPARAETGHPAP